MTNLYKKNEILFAILLIIVYIMGSSIFDGFSTKLYTLIFQVLLSLVLFGWLYKQRLLEEYGLCKSRVSSKKLLYYIPLIVIVSCNLWFGLKMQYTISESVYYVLSMLCVGFLEEMIFRGFLFKAMSKDNLRMAIIVSSVTFGIGHLINLFNGS
ncbi:MAG: CPBP family intramembrane metalloprotease, partial [Erysipelotrichaceae bacterium]|nr:CPBP family intramembrane metalloprotease [Erysipelotrichaceae bacterium]